MTDNKSSESRRKLLKSIAAGSGAIVAGKSLPESWSRPVVDSVILPAHAQTSPGFDGNYTGALNFGSLNLGDTMLAMLVSDARAGSNGMSEHDILCIEVMGGAFRFGLLLGTLGDIDAIYRQDGGTVGDEILWTGDGLICSTGDLPDEVGLKVTTVDEAGAHFELWEPGSQEPFETDILPLGLCPWDVPNTGCDD